VLGADKCLFHEAFAFIACALRAKALNGGAKPVRRVNLSSIIRKHSNGKE
jgi:hypothetical protein